MSNDETVDLIYDNEATVPATVGETILRASLDHGIAHMHVCGGNARCSTCRVIILEGAENLAERNEKEIALARKKSFPENVRLACQTRVLGPARIRRLVMDEEDAEIVIAGSGEGGHEEHLAVLFSDIRGFTPFSERQLPYDIVHILNRYFRHMGAAIINHDGHIDKYIGDGMMALFGLKGGTASEKCSNAAHAAIEMMNELPAINQYLQTHYNEEFRIGIGLHYARVIVGEFGHPSHREFTALGDGVNIASRIESTTKKAQASILASAEFVNQTKDTLNIGRVFLASLKGKTEKMKLYEILSCKERQLSKTASLRRALKKMPLPTAPPVLRLALHEAMSRGQFGKALVDEQIALELLEDDNNKSIEPAFQFLTDIINRVKKEELPQITPSDLIFLAGAVAVELTGGPFIDIELPIQKRQLTEINGESQPKPVQTPGIPQEMDDFQTLLLRFRRLGLDRKELVALTGAHTIGSAHGRPFTDHPFQFDNEFFRRLSRDDLSLSLAMLPSDRQLLKDPKSRELVELYAVDEKAFFHDFHDAYLAMIRA